MAFFFAAAVVPDAGCLLALLVIKPFRACDASENSTASNVLRRQDSFLRKVEHSSRAILSISVRNQAHSGAPGGRVARGLLQSVLATKDEGCGALRRAPPLWTKRTWRYLNAPH